MSLGFKDCPWGLSWVAATAVVTEAKKEDVATNTSNRMVMVYDVMKILGKETVHTLVSTAVGAVDISLKNEN